MVVRGEQGAELSLGQRAAERFLRHLAYGGKCMVVHTGAAQLVRAVGGGLRLCRFRGRGGRRRGQPVQGKGGALEPGLRQMQRAHGGLIVRHRAVAQNIEI